jgi:hypothetical protein
MSNRGSTGGKGARKKGGSASTAAKILGHYGGLRGGPARAAALSKAERVAIARKGGKARQKG